MTQRGEAPVQMNTVALCQASADQGMADRGVGQDRNGVEKQLVQTMAATVLGNMSAPGGRSNPRASEPSARS